MTSRDDTIHALRSCFHSIGSLIDGLTPEQWRAQSLCPAWSAHGVVVHIVAIEAVLLTWRPDSGENPFAAMPAHVQELSAMEPKDLVARYHEVVGRRLFALEAMSDAEFDAPSFTPVGQATYGRFMAIRVFDLWVHERDITVPLGLGSKDGGIAAEMSLDEVQGSIGYIAGKKIGVPDGKSIAFRITGPVTRDILVKVEGRAQRVAELADPDVVVHADFLTFMLLACGRVDPEVPIGQRHISWTGDAELGARAARNLAFTM
jgi:uncharacterized protein (TIGR03083 family)